MEAEQIAVGGVETVRAKGALCHIPAIVAGEPPSRRARLTRVIYMDAPVAEVAEPATGSLELVELELALNHQDFVDLGFEGTVRRAAEGIGGRMLFHMRMDGLSDCDWVAAVMLGEADERKFALVVQPESGGALRVEDAAESHIPVARLAAPYASLLDMLDDVA